MNAASSGIIANGIDGIGIVRAPNNVVRNNTVSGNARMGVGIFESTATGNVIQANRIGTTVSSADFGNGGDGVHISFDASNNTIGGGPSAGNFIAFNAGRGINVVSGTNNRFATNRIFDNDLIGIDLANNGVTPNDVGDGDVGANNLQNFPVLTSAIASGPVVTVQGTLNSTPNTTFQVEIFAGGADPTGFGEGAMPLAGFSVSTNETGSASFTTEVVNVANILTATASDPNGNTSEFSATVAVTSAPTGATIAATDANAAELGDDTATFVISRPIGEPTTSDRLVTVAIGGTASPFSDYGTSSGIGNGASFPVTIPAGQASTPITVTAFFDAIAEGPETVTFTVDGTSVTATITDEPAATIVVTDAAAAELGSDTATFTISRAAGASTAFDRPVTVAIGGTASPFSDYGSSIGIGNGASVSVTIPAGQATMLITVTPFTDALVEGPETVTFTVEGTSATATIADGPVTTARTWISDVDGVWDNPANWSGGVVPQPGETVVIDRPGNITVTLQTVTSIASLTSQERLTITGGSLTSDGPMILNGGLTMSTGQITGAGDLLLGGTSLWTGGQITGVGSMAVNVGATLTVSSPGQAGVFGRNFVNFGTVVWNQESLTLNGLTIVNNTGGVFEIQNNLPISNGTFGNLGRLFKSGPTGPLTLTGVTFVTAGVLDLRLSSPTAFDAIQSDGHVSFGGTLNVLAQGGFVPDIGTTFNVATYDSQDGVFAAIVGNGRSYVPTYGVSALTLTTAADTRPTNRQRRRRSERQCRQHRSTERRRIERSGRRSVDVSWSFVSLPPREQRHAVERSDRGAHVRRRCAGHIRDSADRQRWFAEQRSGFCSDSHQRPPHRQRRPRSEHTGRLDRATERRRFLGSRGKPVDISVDPEHPAGRQFRRPLESEHRQPHVRRGSSGTYIAQLVVNDGLVNSASDTVTITTQNLLPVANAGPDQSNIAINGDRYARWECFERSRWRRC